MTGHFYEGQRVAVPHGKSHDRWYEEAEVERVYKNGNFTLKGSPKKHAASENGILPWTDETHPTIVDANAKHELRKRLDALVERLADVPNDRLTPEMLDAIEARIPDDAEVAEATSGNSGGIVAA